MLVAFAVDVTGAAAGIAKTETADAASAMNTEDNIC
jgi:hypothetical protein